MGNLVLEETVPMGQVGVILNTKGGSTKTTTGIMIGCELAKRGKRILFVDNDSQNPGASTMLITTAGPTTQLRVDNTVCRMYQRPKSGHVGLVRSADLKLESRDGDAPNSPLRYNVDSLRRAARERGWTDDVGDLDVFGVIAGYRRLARIARELTHKADIGEARRNDIELLLATALAPARLEYDFIFIDTPPALPDDSLAMMNALRAADFVLIPLSPELTSMDACLADLEILTEINEQREREGQTPLQVLGIILQRYNDGYASHRKMRSKYEQSATIGPLLFQTRIPEDPSVSDAQLNNVPPQLHSPYAPASAQLPALATEVIERAKNLF